MTIIIVKKKKKKKREWNLKPEKNENENPTIKYSALYSRLTRQQDERQETICDSCKRFCRVTKYRVSTPKSRRIAGSLCERPGETRVNPAEIPSGRFTGRWSGGHYEAPGTITSRLFDKVGRATHRAKPSEAVQRCKDKCQYWPIGKHGWWSGINRAIVSFSSITIGDDSRAIVLVSLVSNR